MSKPMITVIITAYNAEAFIDATLRSACNQSWENLEIIVVDDGSTDRTAAIASNYPLVTVLSQDNGGISNARNHAIACARGEYIAFLDADDLWPHHKLEHQWEFMQQHPELGLSYTLHQNFLDDSISDAPWWVRPETLAGPEPGYMPSALMVTRSALEQIGLFNELYPVCEDIEWLLRAKELHIPVGMVPELLLHKRVHQANLTGQPENLQHVFRLLAASVARRKAGGD